ncbi:MAG: hypothetical protein R2788_18080 [Saprospiraceae bacterium]
MIRVISGEDKDFISDQSNVRGWKKHTLFMILSGKDSLAIGQEAKIVKTKEPVTFTYQLWESQFLFPHPIFCVRRWVWFRFGLSLTKQGFGSWLCPKIFFKGAVTTHENFWFNASADFHHAVGEWDWLVAGKVSNAERSFRQFYGMATEQRTMILKLPITENHTNIEYFSTGLRRTFWQRSTTRHPPLLKGHWELERK